MEEKILKLFRKNSQAYLSGEDISEELNISRSALWKHIEKLRELGYEFDAVPHLGYRLNKIPDRLYSFEIEPFIKTKILGKKVFYYDTLDSTNTTAYNLAEKGIGEGTVVIAEKQAKGRGRLSREWVSPAHKGIYMSLILKPSITPFGAPLITLMAAVSVAQAIREAAAVQALIKWPNDILVNDKKIAGILTEMEAETDSVKFLILGIGINVNSRFSELPKGASSLLEVCGTKFQRVDIAKRALEKLDENYTFFKKGDFSRIKNQWKDLSATLGRRVRAVSMHKKIEGEAVDIENDGSLKIRLDNGFYERIMAGDIIFLR